MIPKEEEALFKSIKVESDRLFDIFSSFFHANLPISNNFFFFLMALRKNESLYDKEILKYIILIHNLQSVLKTLITVLNYF